MWACHSTALTFKCICKQASVCVAILCEWPSYMPRSTLRKHDWNVFRKTGWVLCSILYLHYIWNYPPNLHNIRTEQSSCIRWRLITTYLWNVCSQQVSTSVRCIGSSVPWEIKCKGVENKWAISDLAGICWPSLQRQAFFRILWVFLFVSFGTSWRQDFAGGLFQQFMDSVLFR